jgi:hypothetical protein
MIWDDQEQPNKQSPDAELIRLTAEWYDVPINEVTPGMVTAHAARLLAWTIAPPVHDEPFAVYRNERSHANGSSLAGPRGRVQR